MNSKNDSKLSYKQPHLKPKQKKTKQTTKTETEAQKWRSHAGLSIGEWEGEREGKVQRISSIDDRWKIDRRKGKNSVGNVEAKELISMTHEHELKWGMWEGGAGQDGVE